MPRIVATPWGGWSNWASESIVAVKPPTPGRILGTPWGCESRLNNNNNAFSPLFEKGIYWDPRPPILRAQRDETRTQRDTAAA